MSAAARRTGVRRAVRPLVAVIGVVGVAAAAVALAPGDGEGAASVNDAVATATATVERRDLVDLQDVAGTLGYADDRTVAAAASGTITRLRAAGSTVGRGLSLLSIDATATAWVLYGTVPMYRELGPGATDGRDVRQLERNLVALGYDPGTVDADWTSATETAVRAWQEDRGLEEDGEIGRDEVVVSDGPVRVGEHRAEVGEQVTPGKPVLAVTSTTPVVTAQLDAGLAGDVHRGDRVTVTLADGSEVTGEVTRVGTAATAGEEGAAPTVELRVVMLGKARSVLDGAPVTVSVAVGRTEDALAVPVTALVATAPRRYAVQLAGPRATVPVTLGAMAEGWVEVEGSGLRPGTRVVVPR